MLAFLSRRSASRPLSCSRRRPPRWLPRLEAFEDRLVPTTFLVTTTDDAGPGSLRQAMVEANNNPGFDTIAFQIGRGAVQTIRPASLLPLVTDPVVIDGTTEPGYAGMPLIELNGSQTAGVNGLIILAGGSTVRALVINEFNGDAILLRDNGGNTVAENFLGTNAAGNDVRPNNGTGLNIINSTGNHVLGNLVSGNRQGAIFSAGAAILQGNFVGTDRTGTRSIWINSSVDVTNSLVGGNEPGAGNLITGGGLTIRSGSVVQGNLIGTDITGTSVLGGGGVSMWDDNLIGGTEPGAGNLIVAGWVSIGGSDNRVQGNLIGTNIYGSQALAGAFQGVYIHRGRNNLIGGTEPGARNLISGRSGGGITIASPESEGNIVQGNFIGTDITGSYWVPNSRGVFIQDSPNNLIGGPEPGARNLISGNSDTGIRIQGAAATGNRVQGNWIGLDYTGAGVLRNGWYGISISGASDNLIGGLEPAAANRIAYNGLGGVMAGGTRNGIRQNSIFGHTGRFGIDLGANGNQAYPWLDFAVSDGVPTSLSGGATTVGVTLASRPDTLYTIEFFANQECSATGFGEGEQYVGSFALATGPDGYGTQIGSLPKPLTPGLFLSATATDSDNNTSAFSLCQQVVAGGAPGPRRPPEDRGQLALLLGNAPPVNVTPVEGSRALKTPSKDQPRLADGPAAPTARQEVRPTARHDAWTEVTNPRLRREISDSVLDVWATSSV